jgi:hypothetical protein
MSPSVSRRGTELEIVTTAACAADAAQSAARVARRIGLNDRSISVFQARLNY